MVRLNNLVIFLLETMYVYAFDAIFIKEISPELPVFPLSILIISTGESRAKRRGGEGEKGRRGKREGRGGKRRRERGEDLRAKKKESEEKKIHRRLLHS